MLRSARVAEGGAQQRRNPPVQPRFGGQNLRVFLKTLSFRAAASACALLSFVITAAAQSPNTATLIVAVADQSSAVIKDVNVSVVNNATGAVRDAVSGADGKATFPA